MLKVDLELEGGKYAGKLRDTSKPRIYGELIWLRNSKNDFSWSNKQIDNLLNLDESSTLELDELN